MNPRCPRPSVRAADACAMEGGKEWVDAQLRGDERASLAPQSDIHLSNETCQGGRTAQEATAIRISWPRRCSWVSNWGSRSARHSTRPRDPQSDYSFVKSSCPALSNRLLRLLAIRPRRPGNTIFIVTSVSSTSTTPESV